MPEKIKKTEEEWREQLTPEQYRIMREQGTEPAFTGKYWNEKRKGMYRCAGCGLPLFDSETKYDSGSGWPSFYQPVEIENIEEELDERFGTHRTEIHCARCGSHLGHVFEDGPQPTGLRYCIDSESLELEPKKESRE